MSRLMVSLTLGVVITLTACVRIKAPATRPTAAEPGASLWSAPTDLRARDLFHGPWGVEHAPDPAATYTFVRTKRTGVNPGVTVVDPQGREWSVKQGNPGGADLEGPVEVVLSRLLSAIGYHQPPVYFLPAFMLQDDWGTHTERGGRFRLETGALTERGPWAWEENPFIGTRSYQGLLALLMMFNSTDLKNSNNTLYEYRRGNRIERWYVVRDLGAALGDTNRLAPLKGHIGAFERHPFILGVSDGHVEFAYDGWYDKLVQNRITPSDVAWASDLLAQLSDRQWRDAFRAANYPPDVAERFIGKLHEKVETGRALVRRGGP